MASWLEGATEYLSRTLNPQGEGPAPVPPQVIQAPAAPAQPAQSMAPTTIYVPGSAPGRGGERAQMELQNVKVTYDPVGGAYEAYQLPKRSEPGFTRIYGTMPVSGGGSGALQSGMVSEKPLTPLIYTQSAKEFAQSARPEFAPMILGAPEKFSRLGAEAYGGFVMPLDDRRVTPGTQVSRYPAESGNLARLADPMGVNRPKTAWSELPWTIDYQRSPTFQSITKSPPQSDRLIGGGKVAAMPMMGEGGLKAPFVSAGKSGIGDTITQRQVPTSLIGGYLSGTPLGGFVEPVESGAAWFKKTPILGAVAGVGGDVGYLFTPKTIETTVTGTPFKTEKTAQELYGKLPGAEFTGVFIKGTGQKTSKMEFKTGAPYVVGDTTFQNYETIDFNRMPVIVTPTSITRTQTPAPLSPAPLVSSLGGMESKASEKVYSILPPAMKPMMAWGGIQIEKMGLAPEDVTLGSISTRPENILVKSAAIPAGIVWGGMRGVAEKPITTAASFAVMGIGMGAGFRAIDVVGAKAASGAVEAFPRATSILTRLNTAVLPTALAGVYGTDVVLRSTETMKAGTGRASLRFGEILTTETIPLIAGGYVGYKAADLALSRVPQLYTVPREAEIIAGAKPEERAATKATLDIFKNINRVESPLKNKPDFSQVSGVRDLPGFEGRVKGTEHSIFGRTTEIGQMPKEWIEPRGMTKDVDIFVNKPSEFGKDISRAYPKELAAKGAEDFTALMSVKTGQTALDIHPFPERYPIGRGQEAPTGDYVKALVDPIPKRGGLLQEGGITQEKLFVQTQRKATSLLGEDIGKYGPPEHRMKDVADTLNYVSYLGEQTTGYRKARLQESFGVLKEYFQKPEVYSKYKGGSEYVDMISKMEFGKPSAPSRATQTSFIGREDVSFISVPRSTTPASFYPSVFPSRPSGSLIGSTSSIMSRTSQIPSRLSVNLSSFTSSVLSARPSERSYARPPSPSVRSVFSLTSYPVSPPSRPSSPFVSSPVSSRPSTPSRPSLSFPSISPPYKPPSPIPTRFPGFGWGGGQEPPVKKGKWKSPFREMIPIRSQLFGSGSSGISTSLKNLTNVKRRKR